MRYVFLQTTRGQEDFTTRQIKNTLTRMGHQTFNVWICDARGQLKHCDDLHIEILTLDPERIVWNGISGFAFTELFNTFGFSDVHKIALFYDDPISMLDHTSLAIDVLSVAKNPYWHFFVWDRHWIAEMKRIYGVEAHHTQLAADPQELFRREPLAQFDNHITFVGMLHSRRAILEQFNTLPKELKLIAKRIDDMLCMNVAKVLEKDAPAWSIPDPLAFIAEQDPRNVFGLADFASRRALRWVVWALSKNAPRIAMLRLALRVAPVVMFSEMRQLDHADTNGIAELLSGQVDRLTIIDTSNYAPGELGHAYSSGFLHINATDPQSVDGGIPYRVFHTMACGSPLLTDTKPELEETFLYPEQFLTYNPMSAHGFSHALQYAMTQRTRAELKQIGEAGRQEILRAHTWEHRILDIEAKIKNPTGSAPSSHSSDPVHAPRPATDAAVPPASKTCEPVQQPNLVS